MPRIPIYNNQASIQIRKVTEEAPAIRIPAESFTHEARAMSQLGVTISAIAEDIIKVKADQEYAKAKIEGYKTLSQIEVEASQDDDFQNFEPKYTKRIKDVQETILKTIRSPQAKQAFQQDFELKSTYSFYDIMTNGRKRFIDYDKDLMTQEIVTTKQRYFSASTPGEKQNAKDELAQIFSRRAENKILNKAEAANLYQKEMASLDEGQAEHDILSNSAYALGELQKGKQGAYKELVQDKRIDLIRQAESRIEKIKNQQEEAIAIAVNQKEADLIDMKIAGTLTEQQVKTERQLGTINAKFADVMINALRSPKVYKPTALEGIIKFNELVERNAAMARKEKSWLNMGKVPFEDIAKFRADTINANARGYISDKQMTDLLSETSKTFYRDPIFQNALDQLAAQSKLYATSEVQARVKAEMYGNLTTKVIAGKEPRDAVTEVIKERLNVELGEAVKVVEEGNRIFANKGKQRIYSEDGGMTWHDEATGEEIE